MNDARTRRAPGCVSMLGGPLLALGLWLIAQALLLPHEAETVRLSIITGAFAAGAGAWLLAKRMRSAFPRRAREPRWNEVVIDDTTRKPARNGRVRRQPREAFGPWRPTPGSAACSFLSPSCWSARSFCISTSAGRRPGAGTR